MAMVNMTHKWLYLWEPHTASRATQEALQSLGGSKIGHHHIDINELTHWRNQQIPLSRIPQFKVLATVRNPLDTLVTRWKFSEFKSQPFVEFVRDNMHLPIVTNASKGLCQQADTILYYETLQSDLDWVFSQAVPLRRNADHKTPDKKNWQHYYYGEWDIVQELTQIYKPYLDMYGYSIEFISKLPTVRISYAKKRTYTKPIQRA